MLVRSQDNKRITENIDFTIVKANNQYEIRHTEHTSGWGLYGKYSTFKKAVKALDMMELAYGRKCASHMMLAETMNNTINILIKAGVEREKAVDNVITGYVKAHLFQFPAEDEIEDEE